MGFGLRCATLLLVGPAVFAQDPGGASATPELIELVDLVCADCHGGREPEAGLDLRSSDGLALSLAGDTGWGLLDAVETGFMPPASAGGLDAETRGELVEALRASLPSPQPARAARVRRLNRMEYDACIEALLGVTYDSSRSFPRDAAGYGFDNVGDVMFLTDALVEKYFDAATEVLDLLWADPKLVEALGVSGPEEDGAWLRGFLRLAFRRSVLEQEVQERLDLVDGGVTGPERLRPALMATLMSPAFLFRSEAEHGQDLPQPLDAFELATRLAFLAWGRGPDDELLDLAASGELLQDEALARQWQRLLESPASRALGVGFGAQWLGSRGVLDHAVDFRSFRSFGTDLKRDLHEESVLFLLDLLRLGEPVTDLVNADWTFLNRRLAKHYGIEGIQHKDLRRVTLQDRRRGGVLGMGAVLAVTSHADRTSPVLRGAWILGTLFGAPPPPPPPDAGDLAPESKQQREEAKGPTVRQRLELHRQAPACADCHARIDPMGFALEGFDGVGRLREQEKGQPVDERGVLPDGREVVGVLELKQLLAESPEGLARGFLEGLFVYAIGRPAEPADEPALEAILQACRDAEWDSGVLLRALVLSPPFRSRGVAVR